MVYVLREIQIPLPEHLVRIDERSFRQYMMWLDHSRTLTKFITHRFEEGLLKTIPYNDENRPEKMTETTKNIGELELKITTTPTDKKISYSTLYQKFKGFTEALEEFHRDERLKKDFKLVESKGLYALNNMILEKLEEQKKNSLEGKKGVKQEIELIKPEELLTKIPEIIPLVLDRNYGTPTEYNATKWQEARNMQEEGKRRTEGYRLDGSKEEVKRFKKLVLEDSLQTLGEKPKDPVALIYPFETASLKHQIEPRENTSYESIIESFIKKAPEQIKSNSKIGDLVIINMMEQGIEEKLKEKGLINEELLRDYDPRKEEDGKMYIRLEGLKKRISDYHEKYTKPSLEQNFYILLPPK